MKREILYRGKRIDNGEWVYGYYIGDNSIMEKSYILCGGHRYSVIPKTVGQFTDFKDNFGEKIFEGDKLTGNYTVEFMNGGFYAVRHQKDKFVSTLKQCSTRLNFEVIGDIYDN